MTELGIDLRSRAFLLLDGAAFDAPRFVYENDDQPEIDYLFLGTCHETALKASPCLVKPSETSRLWQKQGDWQHKAVVVLADEGLPVIAGHLRSLLSVALPDGGYSYLRFYSPRQLRRLMSALNDQEQERFSGPIREWLAFQPEGTWHSFRAGTPQPAMTASDEGWFALTDRHLEALAEDAREEFLGRLGRFLSINDRPRLARLLQEANELGLCSEKDVSRYAELAVVHADRIRLPECRAILSNPDLRGAARLAELDQHLAYGLAQGGA